MVLEEHNNRGSAMTHQQQEASHQREKGGGGKIPVASCNEATFADSLAAETLKNPSIMQETWV